MNKLAISLLILMCVGTKTAHAGKGKLPNVCVVTKFAVTVEGGHIEQSSYKGNCPRVPKLKRLIHRHIDVGVLTLAGEKIGKQTCFDVKPLRDKQAGSYYAPFYCSSNSTTADTIESATEALLTQETMIFHK